HVTHAAPPITQKLLVSAGGWPAMKLAQQLHAAGRVIDAEYVPPLLSGTVREGNRNLRSGLRIKSESDVESLCTCRESREWGKICPHALAVGLEYLTPSSRAEPQAESRDPVAESIGMPRGLSTPLRSARDDSPVFVELGSEAATSLALSFILPPNFDSSWSKGQIMLVTEIELDGKRAMPNALQPNERYACDIFDLAALDAFREFFDDAELLAQMRIYPRRQFLRVLRGLRGHPRVTFGKGATAEIEVETYRPHLLVQRRSDESLRLERADKEQLLIAEGEAWARSGNAFRRLAEGLPNELSAIAESPITLGGERALRFVAFEAARLPEWFQVDLDALPRVETAQPRFALKIEGSLREVRAELRAHYGDASYAAGAPEPLIVRDPSGSLLLRNLDAERAALARLGFAARGDKLVLTDENKVARFFAFEYPRLKAEWEVTLSPQATKATTEIQPLAPTVEVVGSGEDWFELRYSLATPDGAAFSSAELQRLLRSGQSKTRLRDGRTAVFDPEAITDFEGVLSDSEPKQNQPGVYRIDRAHSDYIVASAGEIGAALVDPRSALIRLTSDSADALPALDERLRDYQRDGVAWLWRLAQKKLGGILADEMGLGKTVQMLAYLSAAQSDRPALIVCPSSLVTNWRNEAQRFAPNLRVLVLEGPERHARFAGISSANIVLTSYALLQRDAEKYRDLQFATVVLDEAQHIKNPDTQNAQAAFALRARNRFVLTGTPIENSVRDLWSIMNFV
ncbi:MAG: SNF2-related protein, partial [Verrucomicrobiota bacterium]|nr:SNF2-related protein [Verrucomicrobiota bacterium]